MSTSVPPEQPTGQDQQTTPEPAPVVGTGPWANDLAALFADETVRGTVDQFLRTKVQPHTTKLEQQLADSKNATQLWEKLEAEPVDTYVAITHEMFGQQAADQLLAQIQALQNGEEPVAQEPTPGAPFDPAADPRIAAALAYIEEQQTTSYYDGEMARITTEHPEVNGDLLHPFIAAAEGNFDQAYELYTDWAARFSPAQIAEVAEEAPAALGSDTTGATSTSAPMEPKKQSLHGAIEDFMAEQRAAKEAPPVLG